MTSIPNKLKNRLEGFSSQQNIVVLLIIFFGIFTFFNADKININNGFGFDAIYGELAQNFPQRIQADVNRFWIARSFPSLIAFLGLKTFFIDPTPKNVINIFVLINTLSLIGVAITWYQISKNLKISLLGQWLGATALFLNFFVLKETSYNPVRTDSIAYFISIRIFYSYLTKNTLQLYFLTLIGSFSWPSSVYTGGLFLLFPRDDDSDSQPRPRMRWYLRFGLALPPCIGAFIYMNALIPGELDYLNRGKPIESVGYLSAAIAVTYLFFGLAELLKDKRIIQWSVWKKYLVKKSFYVALFFLLSINIVIGLLATAPGQNMTFGHTLYLIILTSILQPGVFLIAHVLYWGPISILILFFWQPICEMTRQYSIGLTLWLMIGVVLGLDSESRHLIDLIPILITFLVKYMETQCWTNQKTIQMAIISLFVSKVWLSIGDIEGDLWEFPMQFYTMTQGPWMSNSMYIAQGSFILFLTYWIYDFFIRPIITKNRSDQASNQATAD